MVLATDGVADGALVVAAVHALLIVPAALRGVDLISLVRFVLSGMFGWIILSGLIYLIGRHGLDGYGSFQGVMAASAIAYPVLLASLILEPFVVLFWAQMIVSAWLVLCLWVATRVALDLARDKAAVAVVGGWVAWVIVSALFRF